MQYLKFIRLFFTCFILLFSIMAFAQNSIIKGSVKDSLSGESIPFANIMMIKNGMLAEETTADSEGNYQFNAVKAGEYDLKVSFVGYVNRIIKSVKVDSASIKTIHIKILQAALEMPEAVKVSSDKENIRTSKWSDLPPESAEKRSTEVNPGMIVITEKIRNDNQDLSGILTAGVLNDFSKWELWQDITKGELSTWQDYWKFKPGERYTVQVVSADGRPLPDCEVSLLNKDKKVLWTGRTDNTGKAELWADMFAENKSSKGYSVKISYHENNYQLKKLLKFSSGINIITLPVNCAPPRKADIMFVVDATGSMSDEIQYLKSELNNIILQVKKQYPDLEINLGSVFYRDKGDEYVTRKSDFSSDINHTINFIKQQNANGGGDEPEAVHTALHLAIKNMKWSDSAVARLMFLVLDAPPHYSPGIIDSLQVLISEAAAKGIRIIPITGSGIDKSAEYLMRAFALATNGTYVFLTDHSNVGNPHIKPTTDEYDVALLKDVLLKLLSQYLYMPPCSGQISLKDQDMRDTMYVYNPKIIAHEIGDTALVGKYNDQNIHIDTNRVSFVDPAHTVNISSLTIDSSTLVIDMDVQLFANFRYYPNPTTGLLTIEIDGKIDELYLADISGKLIEKYHVNNSELIQVNIAKYPVGVYFLQYFYKNKWLSGKVILIR